MTSHHSGPSYSGLSLFAQATANSVWTPPMNLLVSCRNALPSSELRLTNVVAAPSLANCCNVLPLSFQYFFIVLETNGRGISSVPTSNKAFMPDTRIASL